MMFISSHLGWHAGLCSSSMGCSHKHPPPAQDPVAAHKVPKSTSMWTSTNFAQILSTPAWSLLHLRGHSMPKQTNPTGRKNESSQQQHCTNETLTQPAKIYLACPRVHTHLSRHNQSLRPWTVHVQCRRKKKLNQKREEETISRHHHYVRYSLACIVQDGCYLKLFLTPHGNSFTELNSVNNVLLA